MKQFFLPPHEWNVKERSVANSQDCCIFLAEHFKLVDVSVLRCTKQCIKVRQLEDLITFKLFIWCLIYCKCNCHSTLITVDFYRVLNGRSSQKCSLEYVHCRPTSPNTALGLILALWNINLGVMVDDWLARPPQSVIFMRITEQAKSTNNIQTDDPAQHIFLSNVE